MRTCKPAVIDSSPSRAATGRVASCSSPLCRPAPRYAALKQRWAYVHRRPRQLNVSDYRRPRLRSHRPRLRRPAHFASNPPMAKCCVYSTLPKLENQPARRRPPSGWPPETFRYSKPSGPLKRGHSERPPWHFASQPSLIQPVPRFPPQRGKSNRGPLTQRWTAIRPKPNPRSKGPADRPYKAHVNRRLGLTKDQE